MNSYLVQGGLIKTQPSAGGGLAHLGRQLSPPAPGPLGPLGQLGLVEGGAWWVGGWLVGGVEGRAAPQHTFTTTREHRRRAAQSVGHEHRALPEQQ